VSARLGKVASDPIDEREMCRDWKLFGAVDGPRDPDCISVALLRICLPAMKMIQQNGLIFFEPIFTSSSSIHQKLAQAAIMHIQLVDLRRIPKGPLQRAFLR
jgi:hypothetical protein